LTAKAEVNVEARVMVDMSATILHHGHIALLESASRLGKVVVALTSDLEIQIHKGYLPELTFEERKIVMLALGLVTDVVESPWVIDEDFLMEHRCALLVHGDDNRNLVPSELLRMYPRTVGISSSVIRARAAEIHLQEVGQARNEER